MEHKVLEQCACLTFGKTTKTITICLELNKFIIVAIDYWAHPIMSLSQHKQKKGQTSMCMKRSLMKPITDK